jgi:hypothetical protein
MTFNVDNVNNEAKFKFHFPVVVIMTKQTELQMMSQNQHRVELHLSGLIGKAGLPDMQKIRIIRFFFENRLHWQFEMVQIFCNRLL